MHTDYRKIPEPDRRCASECARRGAQPADGLLDDRPLYAFLVTSLHPMQGIWAPAYYEWKRIQCSYRVIAILQRIVAKDLAPYNINVNAICPGLVWGRFWQHLGPLVSQGDPAFAGLEPRELFETWVKRNTPLQREQTPEDIGNLAVFLASEEARNITGQSILVDGGMAMQ